MPGNRSIPSVYYISRSIPKQIRKLLKEAVWLNSGCQTIMHLHQCLHRLELLYTIPAWSRHTVRLVSVKPQGPVVLASFRRLCSRRFLPRCRKARMHSLFLTETVVEPRTYLPLPPLHRPLTTLTPLGASTFILRQPTQRRLRNVRSTRSTHHSQLTCITTPPRCIWGQRRRRRSDIHTQRTSAEN